MGHDHRRLGIRWLEDNWNHRNDAIVDELMSRDVVGHMEGRTIRSREEFRAERGALLSAFPDLSMHVESALADGDVVALRWRMRGTHSGRGLGMEPTHRPVEVVGTTWLRFVDGQIVEGHDTWNQGALLNLLANSRQAAG